MPSTEPSRSSICIAAHGLPSLLRLRAMPVRIPHSATSVFLLSPSRCPVVCVASSLHFVDVLIERMSGDVESEHFFFAGELFLAGPILHLGQRVLGRRLFFDQRGEQSGLSAFPILVRAGAGFHGAVDHRHELRARTFQRIHGAGLDEAFDHAPVHRAQVDALAEFVERAERAVFQARLDDRFDRASAYVLDGAEAEAGSRRPTE